MLLLFWRPSFSLWLLGSSESVKFEVREIWASKMARPRASPTLPRILHPSYYLRRPRRLLVLFAFFVCTTYLLWDRHNLVLHHEVCFAVPQNFKIAYKMHGCSFSLCFSKWVTKNAGRQRVMWLGGTFPEIIGMFGVKHYNGIEWNQEEIRGLHPRWMATHVGPSCLAHHLRLRAHFLFLFTCS